MVNNQLKKYGKKKGSKRKTTFEKKGSRLGSLES